MFVEDILELLYKNLYIWHLNEWNHKFVSDVYLSKVLQNTPLSDGQVKYIISIAKVRKNQLSTIVDQSALELLIQNPKCRLIPYKSIRIPKEVCWVGHNLFAFRFKYDPRIKEDLMELGKSKFDFLKKLWIVPIHNLTELNDLEWLIKKHQFKMNSITKSYIEQCKRSVGQPTRFTSNSDNTIDIRIVEDNQLADWLEFVVGAKKI